MRRPLEKKKNLWSIVCFCLMFLKTYNKHAKLSVHAALSPFCCQQCQQKGGTEVDTRGWDFLAWTCWTVVNGSQFDPYTEVSKSAEQRAFPLVLHATVGLWTACAKRGNGASVRRCLTEQRTKETRWTESAGRREDGKHPLRPVYQTWAVLNQFKTLFSTWQTLHIFLISPDLSKLQHNSSNLSDLWSVFLIDRLWINELICVHS